MCSTFDQHLTNSLFTFKTYYAYFNMMELLSGECLVAISRAAAGCDKLNYILQQKGNATLLERMDLPLLSESKIAELCKYLLLIYALFS